MDPERWRQVEQVYFDVLACEPERRAAHLNEACTGDSDLRREVESLLAANEHAGNFLSPAELRRHIEDVAGEAPPSLLGAALGHYRILSRLGGGGMGEVYLARDSKLDRQVALKILPAEFIADAGRLPRFLREAKAASALNHPNIITIYEIGEAGDTRFIATEFVAGVTLRERLAQGSMALAEALDVAAQTAKALDAAHRAGIVHRDIKPENVMLRPDGLVKVLDFGLARMVALAEESGQTQTGAVMGTPRYMSPEQARGQKLDARSDIFSLGAVLYEMVTGKPAFPGATTAEVFAALLNTEPVHAEGISREVESLLAKALEKSRESRYASMKDFALDLERLAQGRAGSPSRTPVRPRLSARGKLLVMATVAAAGVSFGIYQWAGAGLSNRDQPSGRLVPLTSFAGLKDHASFSPDGSQIAFAWNGGAGPRRDIYIKVVGAGEPLQLTNSPEDEWLPAWSPDGRYIAFSRALAGRQAICLISALGGTERRVAEAGAGLSWAPDGKRLALADRPPPDGNGGILLLSLDSGARQRLTNPAPGNDSFPAWSPDGKRIAFVRNVGVSARELFVVPAGGGAARQLTFDRRPLTGVTWTGDSREIVFASNRGGGGDSLWRVAASGGAPRRVSVTLQSAFNPSISRRGDRLAYTESFLDLNIYRYEGPGFAARAAPGPFADPSALIVSSREDSSPNISPDGEWIAFVSKRTGNDEIWIANRAGGRFTQLTSFGGSPTGTPRWSPDGNWIAFDSRDAGSADIYVLAAQGGAPRRLTTEPSEETMPSWSPDGKWVYFRSNRGGSREIWRMPATGGAALQVTRTGAREAFASPDGRLVYFTRDGNPSIWSVPVDGGAEKPVPGLESAGRTRLWGVLEKGVYFVSKEDAPRQTLRFFSFGTRKVTPLLTLGKEPYWNVPGVAISPDGRWLLIVQLDHEVNDIMLVDDFR